MEEVTLVTTVQGIYCRQCPERITERLTQTRGVIDVSVSLWRSEVAVVYDPGILPEAALLETLRRMGYPACEKGARGSNVVLNALFGRKGGRT